MMFPICFTLILGIFHKILIYLVFKSRWQKNLLLVFWTFQELHDSKKGKVRDHGSQILIHIQQAKVEHQEIKEEEMGSYHAAQKSGRVVQALFAL
jgi:hypothetical protein